MAQYKEGQLLLGSDGRHYRVVNGVPISVGPTPLVQKPTAQFEVPQAQADLAGKTVSTAKTAFELEQERRQAAADTRIKNAQAIQEEEKAANAAFQNGDALGDPKLSGPARLASVPDSQRPLVQLLLNNQLSQLGAFSLKSPQMQSLLSTAKAIDPNFDPSLFGARYKAITDFTGEGKGAQAVGAVNRLAANLKALKAISDQMGGPNLGFSPLNSVVAGTEQSFEPKLRAAYDALLPEIANQFDLIMKSNKGSPTVSGIGEVMNGLKRAQSQDERDAAMQQVVKAVHGAILPLRQQWDSAYGGNTPPPMWVSKDAADFLSSIDPQDAKSYQYENHPLPGLHGDVNPLIGAGGPPPPPGGGTPPGSPFGPHLGPQPPSGPQSLAQMDPNSPLGVFKQTYRNVPDPKAAAALDKLAHTPGATYEQAAALVGHPSFTPDDWKAYTAYAQSHPGYHNATVLNSVPTTIGQRLASSPAAAFLAGGAQGLTAGLSDVAGRTLGGPQFDEKMSALAGLHPAANVVGNVGGGAAGMFGAGAAADALGIAAKAKEALGAARAAKLGRFAPFAQDLGYGATYGASEDPNNPLGGAATGALTAAAGGIAARGLVRGIGSAIAPTGGNLAPIFNANPDFRPTIGQRLSASDSRISRALGMGEQAAESIPGLGGIQTSARTAATDQMQRGAYNHALGELAPFNPILGRDVSQLPPGIVKGQKANDFLQTAMGDAQQTARSGMQFAPDSQYAAEFGDWQRNPDALSLTTDQRNHVTNAITGALKGRIRPDGTMHGDAYASSASDLARIARNWSGNPATAPQAAYLRDYISIMDGAASRASPPEASALLDAANRGYAKSVILENAAKAAGGEPTEFTGKQLLKSVQNSDPSVRDRAFLRGQALMQDYATAASKLSPSLADSGTPQRIAWMRGLGGAEGLGLGAAAALGHPETLAPLALDTVANLPGIRNVVGAAMAPRSAVLPPALANAANLVGQGLYNRAPALGMFGAPLALSYFGGQ
jgi:hypothetical protein